MENTTGLTRAQRAARARAARERRHALAAEVAATHDGVATWGLLVAAGLTRGQIQGELDRGVWRSVGRHTIAVRPAPEGSALWWRAVWESGARAVLDGPTALLAAGLTGWAEQLIHVTVPNRAKVRPIEGVRHHRVRDPGPALRSGLPRTRPEVAVVRAAQWASSDRQAATIVAMTVQQRLVTGAAVLARWESISYSARRRVLDAAIRDVCDGAHSLNELDFAAECRRRGLPEPSRQAVRTGRRGRVYLDVYWDELGVHVEIHGAHHFTGTAGIDDALRANDLGLADPDIITLQIPVLGLRTMPGPFLDQVESALAAARLRQVAS